MRPIRLLTLALVVILGLRYPARAMNARGERILIFGDSLTQHASGANPIWNVDAGPQRQSAGPGDLLASLLFDQGAAVRTNALVSRSAFNFWTREDAQTLIAADLAWKPTKIVFVLGTNDVGLAAAPDEAAFVRLRDAYKPTKAEIWAIGPFTSKLPAAGVAQVAATMRKVFGARFLDGRLLSAMISPGPDGVHYTPTSARLLALNLADALLSASTVKPWVGAALGAAVVVGGALIYSLISTRGRGLAGHSGSKGTPIRTKYEPAQAVVDGRHVRAEIPNQTSISAELNDYEILPSIREVPFSAFTQMGPLRYYSTSEERRTKALAKQIQASREIAPLIVVEDAEGPYILEGGHRFDALRELGAKTFPALVVLDRASLTKAGLGGRGLAGLEIVNGKRWTGSTNELIRSGYKPTPCKSSLDAKGLARCWSRGLGAADAPLDAATKRLVTRARKLIATLAAGDYVGTNDATALMVKINDATLKIDNTGHPDVGAVLQAEKVAAIEAGRAARAARLAEDARRAREEHREAERARPDAWMRGRRGLRGAEDEDEDPQPGEDPEAWWQRFTRRAEAGKERMRQALDQHDALILTARGGRRILVLKTPEMSNPDEGVLRVTTFDEDGPIGHTTRPTLSKLAEEVHRDWHPEAITPATEADVLAWTGTERFAQGAAKVAEMQRLNRR